MWWPRDHTVSRDSSAAIVFEPREGGRIFERTPAGDEHAWGEVLAWEPPHRLVYLWPLMFDRSEATEVEVTFAPIGDSTTVTIRQTGWERLGSAGAARRDRTRPRGRWSSRATCRPRRAEARQALTASSDPGLPPPCPGPR
jgi:uncharacterized protein YndB with AHSA1/START domain